MCYYARTDYDCRDWKWGNMMLRCPRQHRIGETCGAKLVHSESVTRGGALCKICEEIEIKKRRYSKTCDNIQRWAKEPDKFSASLEKAQREARELSDKIKELHYRRPSVASSMSTQTAAPAVNVLPPISTPTSTPGYEYVSTPAALPRRQDEDLMSQPRSMTTAQLPMVNMTTYTQVQTQTAMPKYSMQSEMTTSYDGKTYSISRR